MNNRITICILLCLAILACGQAAALGTFGTKVNAGDPDVGLPLSQFAAIGGTGIPGVTGANTQNFAYLSYWDIGAVPGLYDNQDVVYLQFGSNSIFPAGAPTRIVRANNVRMTGWGSYSAGSYVKPGDSDIGQQLLPWAVTALFPAAAATGYYYMEVDGGAGYGLGDPVYIKTSLSAGAPPQLTETNDIRITPIAGFQAGSRVSLADSDAGKTLTPFDTIGFGTLGTGGFAPTGPVTYPVARLSFFNANGNTLGVPVPNGIYDDGDVVYFDVFPLNVVSPNDVRLY